MSSLLFIDPKTGKPVSGNHKTGHLLINDFRKKKCKNCSCDLVEIWNELVIIAALRAGVPDRFDKAFSRVPSYDEKNICFNKFINTFINYYNTDNIRLKFASKGYVS